jgi:2-amino-4-hydroxy-6-hydroxymethyldihydropteridine diphosphokinase
VTRAAIALGANLGDRAATVLAATRAVADLADVDLVALSAVYETDPVGGPQGQPAFLNAVLVVETGLVAGELLAALHGIEDGHGRVREVRWGPRTLDLDLLAFGDTTSTDPALTLPHPRAHERAFVLVPWADADPSFDVPGLGTVAGLLGRLPLADRAAVRPT